MFLSKGQSCRKMFCSSDVRSVVSGRMVDLGLMLIPTLLNEFNENEQFGCYCNHIGRLLVSEAYSTSLT